MRNSLLRASSLPSPNSPLPILLYPFLLSYISTVTSTHLMYYTVSRLKPNLGVTRQARNQQSVNARLVNIIDQRELAGHLLIWLEASEVIYCMNNRGWAQIPQSKSLYE